MNTNDRNGRTGDKKSQNVDSKIMLDIQEKTHLSKLWYLVALTFLNKNQDKTFVSFGRKATLKSFIKSRFSDPENVESMQNLKLGSSIQHLSPLRSCETTKKTYFVSW